MNYSQMIYYGFKFINIASIGLAIKEYFYDISFF